MAEQIAHVGLYALRVEVVGVLHLLALHGRHLRMIFHLEPQHVVVVDGIDDRVGMEGPGVVALVVDLTSEDVCRRHGLALHVAGVHAENGRACEAEHDVFLEVAFDQLLHLSKL